MAAKRETTMRLEKTPRKLPGNAPVSAHSAFSALERPSSIDTIEILSSPAEYTGDDVERVSLDGAWRRKAYDTDADAPPVGPDVDDYHWPMVHVPNNFGAEPALSMHFGPVYYRKRISPLRSPHSRLVFDSVDYLADVHLDGRHLGRHEGYFAPFAFDVTGAIEVGSTLSVRVQDPFEEMDPSLPFFVIPKRAIKGTLKYHDSRPGGLPGVWTPGWSERIAQSMTTGGIPASVRLEGTGVVRCEALFLTPIDAHEGRIHVALVVCNLGNSDVVTNVNFRFAKSGEKGASTASVRFSLPVGAHRLDLEAVLPDPELWWPVSESDHGRPTLYDAAVDVIVDRRRSDARSTRFGLRSARLEASPKRLVVNDAPVFVKAANYIPVQHFANIDRDFYRRDMELLSKAHLNSVGVHAHLQPPSCYDAADEAGVLVFQDFPLQWAYASGTENNPAFVDLAQRQIAEMAYTYWNHPSIVYWACHNEPAAMFIPGQPPDPALDLDNQVLDLHLEARLRKVDPIRHIHRASGIGDDLHLYDGSIGGGEIYGVRNHESWFVSEYGFWTVGSRFTEWNDRVWPPDDREFREWLSRLSFGPQTMQYSGLPERYSTAGGFQRATELYGAFLAKYQTEWFRIRRGKPFYAYRWHFFCDWWGYAGGGLVDKDRVPKATYTALQAASRPLLVTTSLPHTIMRPSTRITFPIFAVNDRRSPEELVVSYRFVRHDEAVVLGADDEVLSRVPMPTAPPSGAMVAVVTGSPIEVLDEGTFAAKAIPEESTKIGEVTVDLPATPLVGYSLELRWGEEVSAFPVFTAEEGWFPGPGAFVVCRGEPRRLGS